MEMISTIATYAFAFGIFVPLLIGLLALPIVLLAFIWNIVHRPQAR
jgi:hypothetical protein